MREAPGGKSCKKNHAILIGIPENQNENGVAIFI
jgi:hypothetical protein